MKKFALTLMCLVLLGSHASAWTQTRFCVLDLFYLSQVSTPMPEEIWVSISDQPYVRWEIRGEALDELLSLCQSTAIEHSEKELATREGKYLIQGFSEYSGSRFSVDSVGIVTSLATSEEQGQVYYQIPDFSVFEMALSNFLSTELPAYVVSKPGTSTGRTLSSWAVPYYNQAQAFDLVPEQLSQGYLTEPITRELFCDLVLKMLEKTGDYPTATSISDPFVDTHSPTVLTLYSLGIVGGKTSLQFAPNAFLTREEGAVILSRIADLFALSPSISFTETPPYLDEETISSWALSPVYQVSDLGVMAGTNQGFMPQNMFSKEQAVVTIMGLYRMIQTQI